MEWSELQVVPVAGEKDTDHRLQGTVQSRMGDIIYTRLLVFAKGTNEIGSLQGLGGIEIEKRQRTPSECPSLHSL